jgi:hypothetical protein
MTNKADATKNSKALEITHPDMMGDGTEEKNPSETGFRNLASRRTKLKRPSKRQISKSSLELTFTSRGDMELCHVAKIDLSLTALSTL